MGKDRSKENIPVRNTDRTDTDLAAFSDSVYDPPEKKKGMCGLFVAVILLALLAGLGVLALKLGGLIA